MLFGSECTCLCLHIAVILIFLDYLYGITCTSQVRGFFLVHASLGVCGDLHLPLLEILPSNTTGALC